MDTTFSSEDLAFQKEVRDFISNNYPQSLRDSIAEKKRNNEELSREDLTTWHRILGKNKGWSVPGWPESNDAPKGTVCPHRASNSSSRSRRWSREGAVPPALCSFRWPNPTAAHGREQRERPGAGLSLVALGSPGAGRAADPRPPGRHLEGAREPLPRAP